MLLLFNIVFNLIEKGGGEEIEFFFIFYDGKRKK